MKKILLLLFILSNSLWSAAAINTFPAAGNANYGCWDGSNFWISNFTSHTISKVSQNAGIVATYSLPTQISPLQLAWDGKSIWIASADDNANLAQFDPQQGIVTHVYAYNPQGRSGGVGGIQGVMWDGEELWIGIAQLSGGQGSGIIASINLNDGSIIKSVNGNYNVNGLAYVKTAGHKYIFGACHGFISKIDAKTMVKTTMGNSYYQDNLFRLAADDKYVYGAAYTNANDTTMDIQKFDAVSGVLVNHWGAAGMDYLNDILVDGSNIWTVGDTGTVSVTDKNNGTILSQYNSTGVSCVVKGNDGVWTVDIGTDQINFISDTFLKPTPTVERSISTHAGEILKAEVGPNPSNGRNVSVFINLNGDTDNIQVTVMSLSGEVVTQKTFQGQFRDGWNKLPLDNLNIANALYFVMVKCGQSKQIAKMMILR